MSAKLNLHADTQIPLLAIADQPLVSLNISMDIGAEDDDALAMAYLFASLARPAPTPVVSAPPKVVEEPKVLAEPQGDRWNYIEVE